MSKLTELDLMREAIEMARGCQPDDPANTPHVGTVIATDGQILATGIRGKDDHAEKIALDAVQDRAALPRATVYTTLEPCTHHVRRRTADSCADRIVAAQVSKVVIGILDPNQGVCGRGVLQLQRAGIEIQLFPHDLAQTILDLNADFIRAQQSLGIKIRSPQNVSKIHSPDGKIKVSGSLVNTPGPDELYAFVSREGQWWPQGSINPQPSGTNWNTEVSVGPAGRYKIYLVKANALGRTLIHYYYSVGHLHEIWQGQLRTRFGDKEFKFDGGWWCPVKAQALPKGLDPEDWIEIEVTR